jgi:CubicO group peptidase (beta-lactamase class C family)
MHKIISTLTIFCALFAVNKAFGQNGKTAASDKGILKGETGKKFDELLSRYATYGFSGSVLIVKDNQVVISKAYGLADAERGRVNTENTLFDVGSIAKTFTAAAILQLEMQGKLKTDDSIGKYLGEFPSDKAGITIHHLLTHTAGLKLDAGDAGINPSDDREEFLRKAKDAPLISVPGDKYNYSNLGYGLLGIIIEKVSGQNWQTYLKKHLLKPAKLSRTMTFGDSFPQNSLARGYTGATEEDLKPEEPLRQERQDSYMWGKKYVIGPTGIVTTTGDLYKWWQALHSKKILSEDARRKMFTAQAIEQGYGWNIRTTENAITRIHRGGLRGSFQSMLAYYPKENAVLIFALNKNVGESGSLWASVGWGNLEKILLGKDYVVPPAVVSLVPAKLQFYAGEYELPSGEKFVVSVKTDSLQIGAIGQAAVNFLAYPQQSPPKFQDDVNETSRQVIEWLSKNDSAQIKSSGYLSEKDLNALQEKWTSWMNTIGELKSVEILGAAPGSGGNLRTFAKLDGEKSSLVVRLLWNWNQKKLLAWGDDIPLPAVTKFLPESEESFINFDFNKSQTIRIRFNKSADGKATGLTLPSADGKTDVFARKTK